MTTDARPRVAFVGCGAIAEWHWNAFRVAAPRLQLTACVDPDATRARTLAEKTGAAPYPSLAAALAADAADVVVIMVPHHLHEPLAMEALAARRHVILEKPIAPTVDTSERILAAAAAAGVTFLVAENAQYWPGVLTASALLREGRIGDLVTARAWCSTPFLPEFYDANSWRFARATAGGGVAMDAGSHFLRPLQMWCGELVEVVAVTSRIQPAVEDESLCRALCRFRSGVVASFDAAMGVGAGVDVPRFQILGTRGEIVIDGATVRLYGPNGGTGEVMGPSGYLQSYEGEWRDFEAVLVDGTPPAAPAHAALTELRGALAMYRSAQSGRWEPL